MNEHEFEVVGMMETYGGSFVRSLAKCFHHADMFNVRRLKNAFPEYWTEYELMLVNFKKE